MRSSSLFRGIVPTVVAAISTMILASPSTLANPSITALFDPGANGGAGFSLSDEAVINNALAFYNTNMTSTFSLVIDFSTQTAGGATSITSNYGDLGYSDYYAALVTNASLTGNPVQASAVGSLPNAATNPVTGTSGVSLTTTLAALYGLASQVSSPQSSCGGLVGSACIRVGIDELGQSALFGVIQHEFDEVLGTASSLPNGGGPLPDNPSAADLFRYGAPGVRSFAINPDTNEPCAGSTAYFSVNGGTTNRSFYNNCNNGGDYGDWGAGNGPISQVQDAFGDPSNFNSLGLASPEVALLEAVGYDFVSATSTPEPATIGILLVGGAGLWRTRRGRVIRAG